MYNLGIIGAADIAYRMFVPAIKQCPSINCVGIAEEYNLEKLNKFKTDYQLDIFDSFDDLINNPEIDILYIPLPPALHFQYAKKALLNGKHVFLEKPLTTSLRDTKELIDIAKERNLVLQENYMFQFHNQFEVIKNILLKKELGDLRLVRSSFSFPMRAQNDFRYSKELGGGALLDAGGYVVKLGTLLLNDNCYLSDAHLYYTSKDGVDIFGDFTLCDNSVSFQGSFGMDNQYCCSLEIYGSKGKLVTNRIFTSPPDNCPTILLTVNNETKEIILDKDNHFIKSINQFLEALNNSEKRLKFYEFLYIQSSFMEEIRNLGGINND